MVFCPNCQSDFPKEMAVCPDCNQALTVKVQISRPVASAPDDSWVPVARIKGNKSAEKAKRALDSNNIPSVIMPKAFLHSNPAPTEMEGQIEKSAYNQEKLLMVPKDYRFEAKLIVRNALKRDISEI